MPSRRARDGAFTLIEMLVVVAIITALLAIGSPMFWRAMQAARLAVCESNQHQVAHDTQGFVTDHFGRLPAMNEAGAAYDHAVVLDPEDKDPYVMPALAVGGASDLPMSYGLNVEYAVYGIGYSNIVSPGKKVVWFDGTSGRPGGVGGGAVAAAGGNSNKITITHLPPGNPANAHSITISINAAGAHLGHGDVVGDWSSVFGFSAAAHIPGAFDRRHPVSGHVGVVAFADWHVEARQGIDPDNYASPQLVGVEGDQSLPPIGN